MEINKVKSKIIWLTGLSGAGKTTISNNLKKILQNEGISVVQLDGDLLRQSAHSDLGFSSKDREENVRRTAEMAKMLAEQNFCVIVSLITPMEAYREMVRKYILQSVECYMVYVKASVETCQKRDVKGLYEQVRHGLIHNFTGTQSPFEEPQKPDLVLPTESKTIEQCTKMLFEKVFGAVALFAVYGSILNMA